MDELKLRRGKTGSKARKRVGYEPDVPACDRCAHFKGQYMELMNSTPQWHPHKCTLHQFIVNARGCCDSWQHKHTGELLAQQTAANAA